MTRLFRPGANMLQVEKQRKEKGTVMAALSSDLMVHPARFELATL